MEIPKTIHYCWFGGNDLPPLAQRCIESWRKNLPGYTIKRWDESNFNINIIPYTSQAYSQKKYAFVSDYARFWILYNYGGIYLDVDVEILKPLDDILSKGPFMACEQASKHFPVNASQVAAGLGIASYPKHPIYKEILDFYQKKKFVKKNGNLNLDTVVLYVTVILKKHGLKKRNNIQTFDNLTIYPSDYFSPKDPNSSIITKTSNTVAIHHYTASWKENGNNQDIYIASKIFKYFHLPDISIRAFIKYLKIRLFNKI